MTVDVSTVKSTIKVFSEVSDADVKLAIKMATLQADGDRILNTDAKESAIIYFARHLLFVQWFDSYGDVTESSDLGQRQTIANPNTDEDGWLRQYNNIVENYGQSITQGKAIFYRE